MSGAGQESVEGGWEARSRRLLAAAGVALASSLDYATTLGTVARLAVDDFAEWCGLDVLSPTGELEQRNVAHKDPERVEFAKLYQARYPTDLSEDTGLAHVLRTGEAVLASVVTDEMIVATARSPQHLADTRSLGVGSVIIAPLAAQGEILGAITLVHSQQGCFDPRDLELALDVGRLAALALGNARRYSEAQREIEERRRAEAALRESEARFRELADAMPVLVWTTIPSSGEVFTNRTYREYTGLGPEVPGPEGWNLVVHPEDRGIASSTYQASYVAGEPWEQALRLRRNDGEYRWHLSRAVPSREASGEIARWFGTSTDIHEQRRFAEELEQRVADRTADLTEANRELEAFAYSVAHDLRAPLRAVVATSSILIEDLASVLDAEHVSLLERQRTNAGRMGELIDALLALAQVARHRIEHHPIDLTALSRALAVEAGIEDFKVEEGLEANGDDRLLRIVLQNLLGNAKKYSPKGGEISMGGKDGTYWVRDQGIGFDMRYVDKLFRPFERLVGEGEFPGTGIGLATVDRIVRRHGGRVWAESKPGEGSTFFFTVG